MTMGWERTKHGNLRNFSWTIDKPDSDGDIEIMVDACCTHSVYISAKELREWLDEQVY